MDFDELENDEFMNFEEERPGSRLERMRPQLLEIEARSTELKERVQAGKDKAADRMANMSTLAMDALEMGLQSEDEGIRMKALAMWMDRNTNRQGVVREQEVIEVVDESKKMTLEEIEAILKKKGLVDESE